MASQCLMVPLATDFDAWFKKNQANQGMFSLRGRVLCLKYSPSSLTSKRHVLQFNDLPLEIRNIIWRYAMPRGRLIGLEPVSCGDGGKYDYHYGVAGPKYPSVLAINEESRAEAFRHYENTQLYEGYDCKPIYFNPKLDTLVISRRALYHCGRRSGELCNGDIMARIRCIYLCDVYFKQILSGPLIIKNLSVDGILSMFKNLQEVKIHQLPNIFSWLPIYSAWHSIFSQQITAMFTKEAQHTIMDGFKNYYAKIRANEGIPPSELVVKFVEEV